MPVLIADLAAANVIATRFSDVASRLAAVHWPGPLTMILESKAGLPRDVAPDGVALRWSSCVAATSLARAAGGAVTATSANLSGHPAPASLSQLDPALLDRIDAVLDSGPAPGGPPSTIVAATDDGFRLLRAGAIGWDRVLRSATGPARTERRTEIDERADDG